MAAACQDQDLQVFRNMHSIQIYMHVFGSIIIPMIGTACAQSTTGK